MRMFDANARLQLEEVAGYERYVIDTCFREERERHGTASPMTFFFGDSNPYTMKLELCERVTLGGSEIGFPSALSPLLFCAAYKILDMVIEWVIRENTGSPCPWRFSEKISLLHRTPLTFPDFLNTDGQLRDIAVTCYSDLVEFRNAITHGHWGENRKGDLHFDFSKGKSRIQRLITLREVRAWGEAMTSIAGFLIKPSLVTARALDGLRLTCNELTKLHGKPPFPISNPRFFKVIREAQATPFTVDVGRIRTEVEKQTRGQPYEFSLRIEVGVDGQRTVWEIPPELVPSKDFVLDTAWDKYKL